MGCEGGVCYASSNLSTSYKLCKSFVTLRARRRASLSAQDAAQRTPPMLRAVSTTAPTVWRGVLPRACTAVAARTQCIRWYTPAPTYTPVETSSSTTTTTSLSTPPTPTLNPPVYAKSYGPALPDSFAVVMIGGHQYKVTKGDVITTETLQAEVGEHLVLDKVLLVGTKDFTAIGTPLLAKAKVAATIEEQTRLAKVYVFKKKKRKNFQKTQGHRQNVTVLRITDIFMDYAQETQAQKQ